jgi:hypothetical protein
MALKNKMFGITKKERKGIGQRLTASRIKKARINKEEFVMNTSELPRHLERSKGDAQTVLRKISDKEVCSSIKVLKSGENTSGPLSYYSAINCNKVDIDLWISPEGILWEYGQLSQNSIYPHLINEFLSYCLKTCRSVSIFTEEDCCKVQTLLESRCDFNISSHIAIYSNADMQYIGKSAFKVIPSLKFDQCNTLILDIDPTHYSSPQFNHVVIPRGTSANKEALYKEIVELISCKKQNVKIPQYIRGFCAKAKRLRLPTTDAIVEMDQSGTLVWISK